VTNNELDHLLKSVPAPRRPDEYWRDLPKRVTAKIHWLAQKSELPAGRPLRKARVLAYWGLGLATVCIVAGFMSGLWRGRASSLDTPQMAEARKYYDEIEALFPNQVQAIVFDRQGPHFILASKANVPSSPPFYVKVCGPKGCQGFVTFSGQQIQFNGKNCEVLADEHGQVILVGEDRVWSGHQSSGPIRIDARPLAVVL
jgi:hypothetical protein